jgi:uncharacterized membrane protein
VRLRTLVVTAVVVGLLTSASAGGVNATQSNSSSVNTAITGLQMSPESPVPGELVTISVTIQNFQTSTGPYVVESVAVRDAFGDDYGASTPVRDLGQLSPGASLQVPLTVSAESPGTRHLQVVVHGRTTNGESIRLTYPLTMRVTDAKPKVDVTVSDPVHGVTSNATVTVANGLERDLRNVEVQVDGPMAGDELRQVRPILQAGDTEEFSFQVVPTQAGETKLTATVEYSLAGGATRVVSASRTVEARQADSEVGLSTNLSAGRVLVTATNLGNVDVSELTLSARHANQTVSEQPIQSLAPGNSETVALAVDDVEPTDDSPTVSVVGTYEVGTSTRTVRTDPVHLRHGVTLNASVRDGRVAVETTNEGNLRLERVVVQGTAPNAAIERGVIRDLAPGESRTTELPVRNASGVGAAQISATYTVGDVRGSAVGDRITLQANAGRIELTGLDAQPRDGHLLVSGSASNIGLSSIDSVVVSVVETDGVTPVSPQREYFVGSVPASDFISFEVTARVDDNVTAVPLRVAYLAEGERRTERVSVPVRHGLGERGRTDGSNGSRGLVLPASIGGVVLGAVGVIVFMGWRNRDVGDRGS